MYYKWKIYYRHYYYSSCWFSSTSTTATAAAFAVFMIFSRLRPKRHFSTLSPRREARLFIYNVSRGLRRWAAQKTEICLCFDSARKPQTQLTKNPGKRRKREFDVKIVEKIGKHDSEYFGKVVVTKALWCSTTRPKVIWREIKGKMSYLKRVGLS